MASGGGDGNEGNAGVAIGHSWRLGLVRQGSAGPWATGGMGLLEAQMARLGSLSLPLNSSLYKTEKQEKEKERREG